jgi:hypothetical protein
VENKEWVEVEVAPTETPKADVTPVEVAPEEEKVGHRAEKRIKQLLARVKDAEDRASRAETEAAAKAKEAIEALEKAKGTESSAHAVYRNSLQDKIKVAEKRFQDAYDAADRDALLAALKDLNEASLDNRALEAWDRSDKRVDTPPPPSPPQQQQVQLAPATKEWMDSNPWFGRGPDADRLATAAAVAISDDLVAEGFDPNGTEFYEEVEKRLVAEMPRLASKISKGEPEPRKPVVAGQSRTPSRRIRLDEGTVRASNRLGASLEDTARYMEKIQDAGEGYVNIDIKRGRK